MVNTKEYEETPDFGVIEGISNVNLREHLGDNVEMWADSIDRFPDNVTTRAEKEAYIESRLDEDVLLIKFSVGQAQYSNFFTIPKTAGGYMQSNLRKIKKLNDLPDDTDEWTGHKVKLGTNKKGFPEIAR